MTRMASSSTDDGRSRWILQLGPDPLWCLARFLSLTDLLHLRLTDQSSLKALARSPIWSYWTIRARDGEMNGPPSWYVAQASSEFQRFLLYRRFQTRWALGSPLESAAHNKTKATTTFDVEVFARIKDAGDGMIPQHMLCDMQQNKISLVHQPQDSDFQFSQVFPPRISQRTVFEKLMGRFLVDAACGLSSTVFFYGQTGSGKTHTSLGASGSSLDGIVPETIKEVLSWPDASQIKFRVLEIYCEKVKTLVGETRLTNFDREASPLLQKTMQERAMRSTAYNARSSRSHAIFSLRIVLNKGSKRLESTLNLVDLAGAERQRDDAIPDNLVGCTADIIAEHRRISIQEASKINVSLTALGRVIRILSEDTQAGQAPHVPYRDSKLTLLLRASLGGSSGTGRDVSGRTAFVLTLSDDEVDWRETLSTLQFGKEAQKVRLARSSAASSQCGLEAIAEITRKLWKTRTEMTQLENVWRSCGQGRHDPICRCDRCLERSEEGEESQVPMHIPRYAALVETRHMLEERLEEARLAMLGAFA